MVEPSSEADAVDLLLRDVGRQSRIADQEAKNSVNAENSKADEKDKRREMRVVYFLLACSVVDGFMFAFIENWAAPLVMGALQLLAALIYAKNHGVEEIQLWLNKVISKFPANGSRKRGTRDLTKRGSHAAQQETGR